MKKHLCLSKLHKAYFEHKNQNNLSSVLPAMQHSLISACSSDFLSLLSNHPAATHRFVCIKFEMEP